MGSLCHGQAGEKVLLETLQHVDAVLWTGGEDALKEGILELRVISLRGIRGLGYVYESRIIYLMSSMLQDDAGVHGARYPDVMMDSLKTIYDHVSRSSLPLQLVALSWLL